MTLLDHRNDKGDDGRFVAVPDKDKDWLHDILMRCGRCNTLKRIDDRWEVRGFLTGDLIDQDTDFNALFWRHYDWEEDVPGYEGLLWRSPARMNGFPCLKGTRVLTKMVKLIVQAGDDPFDHWSHITAEQIEAALGYDENY